MLRYFPPPTKPYLEKGIVFYAYGVSNSANPSPYLEQTLVNAQYLKKMDPTVCFKIYFILI